MSPVGSLASPGSRVKRPAALASGVAAFAAQPWLAAAEIGAGVTGDARWHAGWRWR